MVQRWRQLPLGHALSHAGRVHALVQSLADQVAGVDGAQRAEVPDCGPGTLMDQLTVMVYDASASALPSTTLPLTRPALTTTLTNDLANLRRELR